jgi:N-dimethylarginine dimethylaminohydrolase
MFVALTHSVSPNFANGEVTFIDREPINYTLALQQHKIYCKALTDCGIRVEKLSTSLDLPDKNSLYRN